ncbi:MAG: porin family protein [Acidobacteria bacterium]|nr:porin family protein [Acidobacteriota bacterium]
MRFLILLLCVCPAVLAQVGEISISGGVSRFGDGDLGTLSEPATSPRATIDGGFSLAVRLTLNTYRFFGHEFGYSYSRSTVNVPAAPVAGQPVQPAQEYSVPVHQGVYNFLLYATPEGTRVRPFATGGGHFSSFFPPGTSVYYGNQITKIGFNYGGGLKARVTEVWGVRVDVRQYVTGQPFDFFNQESTLRQLAITAGVSFNF